jgi:nitrate reductase cytochrome c-type subunit
VKRKLISRHCLIACALLTIGAGLAWAVGRELATARSGDAPANGPVVAGTNHPVIIGRPAGPPAVPSGLTDHQGDSVQVTCGACHTTTQPNLAIRSGEQLEQFHQGLHYAHGSLSCLSCHNAEDYDTLRLADGSPVEFGDVMQLCGQCHGPQLRDYERGLHGGMTGYWDLTRGPRHRHNCITCHDPHAPAYPLVHPVFPPRDRVAAGVHP